MKKLNKLNWVWIENSTSKIEKDNFTFPKPSHQTHHQPHTQIDPYRHAHRPTDTQTLTFHNKVYRLIIIKCDKWTKILVDFIEWKPHCIAEEQVNSVFIILQTRIELRIYIKCIIILYALYFCVQVEWFRQLKLKPF